jgi:predicted metal-binding membrane protein
VTALAWVYLAWLAVQMGAMPASMGEAVAMTQLKPWTALDFALMLLMWAVMMVGMMVPSAAPMILMYAMVARRGRARGQAMVPTGVFVSGYAVAWGAFSVGAVVLQWALEQAALLSPMMVSTSPILGGALLIAAGIYQWTPIKDACLRHCRTPIAFLMTAWRPGRLGAFRMGVEHGLYCVGCCWVLMGLLFFGGVMNLLWIAAIAAFVFAEKIAPMGARGGRLSGILLIGAGAAAIAYG